MIWNDQHQLIQARHYHYDALGQSNQSQYYAYEPQDRLAGARLGDHGSRVESWQFDWAGNPLPALNAEQPKPQDWSERVRQHWQDPNFNLLSEGTQAPSEQVAYWLDNRVLYSEHAQYQYDAQGNRTQHTEHNGETQRYYYNQPIRLPGQYHDAETNLYYNRHRYYDPKLGNYINQDPLGLASGEPNLTMYPRNPIQGMDPLGLRCEVPRQSVPEPLSPGVETSVSIISNFLQTNFTRVTGAVHVVGEGAVSGGIAVGVGALGHYRQAFRAHKNDLIYQAGGLGKENINNCIDKLLPIWDEIPGSDVECAMRQIGPVCGGLL